MLMAFPETAVCAPTLFNRVLREAAGAWVRCVGREPHLFDWRWAGNTLIGEWADAGCVMTLRWHRLMPLAVSMTVSDASCGAADFAVGDFPHCNVASDYPDGDVAEFVGRVLLVTL